MYKLEEWTEKLDLSYFYAEAEKRGYENNRNQQVLVDCFNNERKRQVWILYQNTLPIGSVAAHSLDLPELGENSYRICVRTCTFVEAVPRKTLSTSTVIFNQHQNLTAQFFIPKCIVTSCSESR